MIATRLVDLIWDRGPEHPTDTLILLALDRFTNRHTGTTHPKTATIARLARCNRATVHRRLIALERDGWITVIERGGGRGRANLYRLNPERFSTDPEKLSQVMRQIPGPKLSHLMQQIPDPETVALTSETVALTHETVAPGATPTHRTLRNPSSSGPDATSPAAALTPADDDAAIDPYEALDGIPGVHAPATVRAMIHAAYVAGWTPTALNAHLRGQWGNPESPMALLRHLLADLPPAPATPPPAPPLPPKCDSPDCGPDRMLSVIDVDDRLIVVPCPDCNPKALDTPPPRRPRPIQSPLVAPVPRPVNGHDEPITPAATAALAAYLGGPRKAASR